MSIPRNHHYVSQVLTRKFKDANDIIYLYNKTSQEFSSTQSTKHLFSERDLNSTITEEGVVDHSSVEEILNRNFETGFNSCYETVVAALANRNQIPNYEEVIRAIQYLVGMGIIGEMRNPHHMAKKQEIFLGTFRMLLEFATPELKTIIQTHEQSLSGVKNKLPVDFKEISDGVTELMGDIWFSIFIAPENEYFLLPDCSSAVFRSQLEDDNIVDGETYYNLSRPISTVMMPINSKVLIMARAAKICSRQSHGTGLLTSDLVYDQNQMLYKRAYERVACENEEYLKRFMEKNDAITANVK